MAGCSVRHRRGGAQFVAVQADAKPCICHTVCEYLRVCTLWVIHSYKGSLSLAIPLYLYLAIFLSLTIPLSLSFITTLTTVDWRPRRRRWLRRRQRPLFECSLVWAPRFFYSVSHSVRAKGGQRATTMTMKSGTTATTHTPKRCSNASMCV